MGVEFETNVVVGKTVTIDELMEEEGYDAVFIGTGAGLPQFMNIPGEHLNGVYSANEFLTRINLMHAYEFPKYDEPMFDLQRQGCGRDRRRQHRAGRDPLSAAPGRKQSVRDLSPQRSRDAGTQRRSETCQAGRHRVSRADQSGRVSLGRERLAERGALHAHGTGRTGCVGTPTPGAGAGLGVRHCLLSVAVIAIGTGANPLIQSTTPGLNTNKRNYIEADAMTQRTSRKGVFAGGDIVTGSATVILAMGAGRRAAKSIHEYLTTSGTW